MREGRPVALGWTVVAGFERIVTHPGIQAEPLDLLTALTITDEWLAAPNVHVLQPGPRHYRLFRGLREAVGVGGNLVTDAQLAALAMEHQCELHGSE